jgi:hypothetical protein
MSQPDVAACGRGAKLAQGFEEGSAVAGDVAGDAAGKMAAEDAVAADPGGRGAGQPQLVCFFVWVFLDVPEHLSEPEDATGATDLHPAPPGA